MGHEPLTKYVVLAVVATQLTASWLLRHTHPLSPSFLFTAYALGGTANHNLFLAIHEITHNLAFKGINANKWLAIFANLPIGIPYASTFKVSQTPYYCSTRIPDTSRSNITSTITSNLEKMAWIPIFRRIWN